MFLDIKDIDIKGYWYKFWGLYGADILSYSELWYKDEDITGLSCKQFKVYQYYLSFYYSISLMKYMELYPNKTWDEVKATYDITNMHTKFGCNGINLDKVFALFELPYNCEGAGINCEGIEETQEVEGDTDVTVSTVDIDTLLDQVGSLTITYNYESNCS